MDVHSETETYHKKDLNKKLSLLIALWILDKIIMLVMFLLLK